jgi:hypothetical protein
VRRQDAKPPKKNAGHSCRCGGARRQFLLQAVPSSSIRPQQGRGVSRSVVILILRRLISGNFGQTPIEKYALLSRRPVSEITFAERWGERWPALSPAVGQPVCLQALFQ